MALPIGHGYGSTSPVGQVTTLTTNSTTTLSPFSRAIYIATDGTLEVTLAWTTASVSLGVVAGAWLPLEAKEVHSCPAGSLAFW
jgi:hypothetical protein